MDPSGNNMPPSSASSRSPGAELLVREAHKAADAVAEEAIAFLSELHPELLNGLPLEFDEAVRLAIRHASLRWICGVSVWWARKRQAETDGHM